jgi:hypothetical protein
MVADLRRGWGKVTSGYDRFVRELGFYICGSPSSRGKVESV